MSLPKNKEDVKHVRFLRFCPYQNNLWQGRLYFRGLLYSSDAFDLDCVKLQRSSFPVEKSGSMHYSPPAAPERLNPSISHLRFRLWS